MADEETLVFIAYTNDYIARLVEAQHGGIFGGTMPLVAVKSPH